jgi:hypothetical protein
MSNFLQDAAAWLADTLVGHAATPVTYRRGANTQAVDAIVGETLFKSHDPASGALIYIRSRDYLIRAQDLVLAGTASLPERGDQIEEAVGDFTYIYTVLPFNDEPFYRWSDQHRTLLRIHTRRTGTQ